MRRLITMHEHAMTVALTHPAQQRMLPLLAGLIDRLRLCRSDEDYYTFQLELLRERQQHETWRAECARAADRLRRGKQPKPEAPPMEVPGASVDDPSAWRVQAEIYTRLTHQLREIGDALAWRLLGFRRDLIVALSRNEPPGPMDPTKEGTQREIDFVQEQWHEGRWLALMHDLTDCLRIGDATVFVRQDDQVELQVYELKSNPRRKDPVQITRIVTALAAVDAGGPLPGVDTAQRLLAIPEDYRTHLDLLRVGIDLANTRGSQTIAVPGGRAIEVHNLPVATRLAPEKAAGVQQSRRREAERRAGLRPATRSLRQLSVDLAGYDPRTPPWAIYPLASADCARLITNATLFATTLNLTTVQEALQRHGVQAWLPTSATADDRTVLYVQRGNRRSGMGILNFQPLLLELLDLEVWARAARYVLDNGRDDTKPWPFFRHEDKLWL